MTHDPDPAITTDVYEYLMGDGFVMGPSVTSDRTGPILPSAAPVTTATDGTRLWPDIEDDVRELERLLR